MNPLLSPYHTLIVLPDINDEEELGDEGCIVETYNETGAEVEEEAVGCHQKGREMAKNSPCSGKHPAGKNEEMS